MDVKHKNLLLITSAFPYGNGEQFLETEIKILATYFEKIVILPSTFDGNTQKRVLPNNVFVMQPCIPGFFERFKSRGIFQVILNSEHRKIIIRNFLLAVRSGQLKLFLSATSLIISILGNQKYLSLLNKLTDCTVYYYWGHGQSYALPFLQFTNTNKIVMRLHRGDLYETFTDNFLPFRKEQLSKVDVIAPISTDGKQYLSKLYPEFKHKIRVSRLGTQIQNALKKTHDKDTFHMVSVSTVTPIKRVHKIAEALSNVNSNVKIRWTHFGDGNMWGDVVKFTKTFPSNIEFVRGGFVSNLQLMDFYAKNDVKLFINVSESEGIPVSIMEAISFGIPVLATDVGGNKEIVNEEIGILIHPDFSTERLSAAIHNFVNEEYLFCPETIKKFWYRYYFAGDNYKNFCEEILIGNKVCG